MDDQQIVQLEERLERLIEGAFTHVFGKRLRAQDIALQLARAMEDNVHSMRGADPRPIAPNYYLIHLHPQNYKILLERQPNLASILSQHIIELSAAAGNRLDSIPFIEITPDPALNEGGVSVEANHTGGSDTAVLQRDKLPTAAHAPKNPQMLIEGRETITLDGTVINFGRSRSNHIVMDDPHVSRQHAQIRLRFGHYMLFDTNSASGTYVNDIRVKEHRLQSGDVVCIGKTRMVYLEDEALDAPSTGLMNPVIVPSESE
ncbi:MAG: DUF3662 domain-containing protein [Burkholderiales bacterium]|nr:DUF3662 domain-containing protein [Anaerolineae bacterium]